MTEGYLPLRKVDTYALKFWRRSSASRRRTDRVPLGVGIALVVPSPTVPGVLGLPTTIYDPMVHYQQVRDAWGGVRAPDGR